MSAEITERLFKQASRVTNQGENFAGGWIIKKNGVDCCVPVHSLREEGMTHARLEKLCEAGYMDTVDPNSPAY